MKIAIINGPNLNMLGEREINIYGIVTFEKYFEKLISDFEDIELTYFQSNIEGELVSLIQNIKGNFDYLILNPGAYTHTSIAIADAVKSINTKTIEVHISQVFAREPYRKKSYVAEVCIGSISGLGLFGYDAAIKFFKEL